MLGGTKLPTPLRPALPPNPSQHLGLAAAESSPKSGPSPSERDRAIFPLGLKYGVGPGSTCQPQWALEVHLPQDGSGLSLCQQALLGLGSPQLRLPSALASLAGLATCHRLVQPMGSANRQLCVGLQGGPEPGLMAKGERTEAVG